MWNFGIRKIAIWNWRRGYTSLKLFFPRACLNSFWSIDIVGGSFTHPIIRYLKICVHSVCFISNTWNSQPVSDFRFSIVIACDWCLWLLLIFKKNYQFSHMCPTLPLGHVWIFKERTNFLSCLFSKKISNIA